MKIIRLLALALLLMAQGLVCAGLKEGAIAYNAGDYATALREWKPFAEYGDSGAQYALGAMYAEGLGVSQDYNEALKWYRKAAEQGHAGAQYDLGIMYHKGRGVPQGDMEAAKWYSKAAEQGFAKAQYNLGLMYQKGLGVSQDYNEALKWYRKAAEQGLVQAQNNLGNVYDLLEQKEAVKWYRRAAEQGHALAQYNLGCVYMEGRDVPQDYKEAAKWYRKAAEQGYVTAQNNLGSLYYIGQGVPQDYKEAMKWYRKAAEQGDTEAQNILGIMYGSGYGVQQDYVQAYMWCSIAGENGYKSGSRSRDLAASKMTPFQIADAQRLAREWMERHPYLTKLEAAPNQAPTQDVAQALDHLPDRVPGGTLADVILQRDIINYIAAWNGFNGNKGFQGAVLNTRLLTPSPELISEKSRESLETYTNIAVKHGQEPPEWAREEWMIDRNGINVYYEIILIESYPGGIDILMGRMQEVPFSD